MSTIIRVTEGDTLDFILKIIPAAGESNPGFENADRIWCELSDTQGAPLTRIILNPSHPNADWAEGVLVIAIAATDATRDIGTVSFSVTMEWAGQVRTFATGDIMVRDRPAYP